MRKLTDCRFVDRGGSKNVQYNMLCIVLEVVFLQGGSGGGGTRRLNRVSGSLTSSSSAWQVPHLWILALALSLLQHQKKLMECRRTAEMHAGATTAPLAESWLVLLETRTPQQQQRVTKNAKSILHQRCDFSKGQADKSLGWLHFFPSGVLASRFTIGRTRNSIEQSLSSKGLSASSYL